MNLIDAIKRIRSNGTKEFKLEFQKRSNNQLRELRCTYLAPQPIEEKTDKERAPVDTEINRLINVWDLDENKFKSVPIDGIRRVNFDGEWITIQPTSDAGAGQPSQATG